MNPEDNKVVQTENVSTGNDKKPANKLPLIIAGVLALLFLTLIALVVMLLTKDNPVESDSKNNDNSLQSTNDSSSQGKSAKKVVSTHQTDDEKLEILMYEPRQTATNTTIDFGVRNKCDGCTNSSGIFSVVYGFDNKTDSYLLDDNAGKKFSTITDEDGNVLATPTCNDQVKYNEVAQCFVAFSKVPAGSTVSWVFGKTRISGIKVE